MNVIERFKGIIFLSSLACLLLSCSSNPNSQEPTIPFTGNVTASSTLSAQISTPDVQPTPIEVTATRNQPLATELPTVSSQVTVELTVTSSVESPTTATPQSVGLRLDSIEHIINTQERRGLDSFMTAQFSLHPLPYMEQIEANESAARRLEFYLGDNPQVTITEEIPEHISVEAVVQRPFDAIAYSEGWGITETGEGLLTFTADAGELFWSGLILSFDGFVSPQPVPLAQPPEGLTYRLEDGVYAVTGNDVRQVVEFSDDSKIYRVNPNNTLVFVLQPNADRPDRSDSLELLNLLEGTQRTLDLPYIVVSELANWVDNCTVALNIWLNEDDTIGQNPGRPALLNIGNNEWTLLEPELQVPIMVISPGYVAYETDNGFVIWHDGQKDLLPLSSDSGMGVAVPSPTGAHIARYLGNEYALLDVVTGERSTFLNFNFRVLGRDGYVPPGIIWSPMGKWVALQPETIDLELSGIWLVSVENQDVVHLGIGTSHPVWQNDDLLVFNAVVDGVTLVYVYNVLTGEYTELDLPEGAIPFQFANDQTLPDC